MRRDRKLEKGSRDRFAAAQQCMFPSGVVGSVLTELKLFPGILLPARFQVRFGQEKFALDLESRSKVAAMTL